MDGAQRNQGFQFTIGLQNLDGRVWINRKPFKIINLKLSENRYLEHF